MEVNINDLKPSYNIIDIRDKYSYDKKHIYNSTNIPVTDLLNNPSKYINKNDTYYIYCAKGISSKKTCELLSVLGYKVVNVKGGIGE